MQAKLFPLQVLVKGEMDSTPRVDWQTRKSYLGDIYVQGWMSWWDAYITTKLSQLQHLAGLQGPIGITHTLLL